MGGQKNRGVRKFGHSEFTLLSWRVEEASREAHNR